MPNQNLERRIREIAVALYRNEYEMDIDRAVSSILQAFREEIDIEMICECKTPKPYIKYYNAEKETRCGICDRPLQPKYFGKVVKPEPKKEIEEIGDLNPDYKKYRDIWLAIITIRNKLNELIQARNAER